MVKMINFMHILPLLKMKTKLKDPECVHIIPLDREEMRLPPPHFFGPHRVARGISVQGLNPGHSSESPRS